MIVDTATKKDLSSIVSLVKQVASCDVLPLLSIQGQTEFTTRVLSDIETTLDTTVFCTLKVVIDKEIVGYGALRNGNYLTHLFISKHCQGKGIGKALLTRLLETSTESEIDLRSSVNAASFYENYGFNRIGEETEFNGIRFVPMRLVRF